ncbi:MAG TPA: GxxExxY protein [Steroidobacteraceae bacterium]|nr:GxxExxY protein [Steroidobacteraceae bacterium]
MESINLLADLVRQTAYELHVYHSTGHLERIYENGLANRLRKRGVEVDQQVPLPVYDEDGTVLGTYVADMLVAKTILLELKTVRMLTREHEAQVLAYLKSCRVEHALLINFGSYKFEIRKYANRFSLSNAQLVS